MKVEKLRDKSHFYPLQFIFHFVVAVLVYKGQKLIIKLHE